MVRNKVDLPIPFAPIKAINFLVLNLDLDFGQ
jgi:hypothetical protein